MSLVLERVNSDPIISTMPFHGDMALSPNADIPVLATPATTVCPTFVAGFKAAAAAAGAFTAGFTLGQAIGK